MPDPSSKLRIAHLVASLAVGGKERTVADLCRSAPAHLSPIVVTFEAAATGSPSISVAPVPHFALERQAGRRALSLALAELLEAQAVDLVHAHGHVAAIFAADAARHRPLPVVATLHADWRPDWRWLVPIVRALRRADRVIAVSDDLARRFARVARVPVGVVPTGVDLARHATAVPALCPKPPGVVTIGMAGRFHPVKRHEDAFAAVSRLAARGRPVRLLVAGAPEAAALRSAFPAADIRLLPVLDDMRGFYASIDALLLTSEHEGTPLVLLEAMASGVPCVATRVGGIPDLVRTPAGDCALLVPPRDVDALAATLDQLVTRPALRSELAARAGDRVSAFSIDAQAQANAALYQLVTDSARLRYLA